MAPVEVEFGPVQPSTDAEFVSSVCLPFLRAAQNEDGGWGFHPGPQSRVEATSWTLLALSGTGIIVRNTASWIPVSPRHAIAGWILAFLSDAKRGLLGHIARLVGTSRQIGNRERQWPVASVGFATIGQETPVLSCA